MTYYADYFYGWGDPGSDYEAEVLGQAEKAIALAPDNVRAYYVKAAYLSISHRAREGLATAEAGLAINPNFVMLFLPRIEAELALGRFEQAKADAQRAIRLSPHDPFLGVLHHTAGLAELELGHADAAVDQFGQAIDSGYRVYTVYGDLAAVYATVGKIDEAKIALAEARRLNPKLTVKWWQDHLLGIPAVVDGLRKAGLPEE